ncbi:MAG: LacI family DNA-binding transcriptional regulator [Nakamurella sp.]
MIVSSPKLPVMTDVAALAGVSHQTVSRVLNTPELVKPDTRKQVLDAIEQLGYRRNLSARALATKRTRLIGVIDSGVSYFGPGHTTRAIEAAARSAGYATITAGVENAGAKPHDTLEFFLNHAVEGLVIVAPTIDVADAVRPLAGTLATVVIATGLDAPEPMHVVAVDHEQGARDATRHLLTLGHRAIAHIAGPDNWFDARARRRGWEAELRAAGLPVPDPIPGGWDARDGYAAAARVLTLPERPTAVFAANDLLALGLMRHLHEVGLRVPDDIAVVGYDDSEGSDYFTPSLTTIRQPFDLVGTRAMSVLVKTIEGGNPSNMLIVPTLIVRESCGAAR